MSESAQSEWLAAVSVALVRYSAMLAGTLAGQLGGIAIDAVVGTRSLWIPLALSVVLEALAGARVGTPRSGPYLRSRARARLDSAQSARVSTTYTLGLVALSVPLIVWIAISHRAAGGPGGELASWTPAHVAVAALALAAATLVRWRLMVAFGRRGP